MVMSPPAPSEQQWKLAKYQHNVLNYSANFVMSH
jgi:hypothetical protein